MYHCFSENIDDRTVTITGSDVNHIRNVLRMRTGDDIYVSDGHGRNVLASISSVDPDVITADIIKENACDTELPVKIVLYQGLPKAEKMELIIQKCVELGVTRIVPVRMSRCIVKLDDKAAAKKIERWRKISESAAKQSQRGIVPEISPIMSFSQALKDAQSHEKAIIPFEHSSNRAALKTLLESFLNADGAHGHSVSSIGILIGPEGGFEDDEVALAEASGIIPISLGKRILRTETAGLAIVSALMLNIEASDMEELSK